MGSNSATGDEASSFCLKWNDYASNLSVAFSDLRRESDFFDVTLLTKDGAVHAHKVILRYKASPGPDPTKHDFFPILHTVVRFSYKYV
jgi:hypothetical protein